MKDKIIEWVKKLFHKALYCYNTWFEWEEAKCWANNTHPGWVHLAVRARSEETRKKYREKIILAYLGELEDG